MADGAQNNAADSAEFTVLAQYVKDFSFESPNAPASLRPKEKGPQIDIGINVNGNPIGDDNYNVELTITAKAGEGKDILFNAELVYGGVFRLKNIPEEHVMPLIFVECPRLLFPFARQIIADATRNGGFPPLMIDPVDFLGMFQKRMAEQKAAAEVQ